jgi:hypothetical protein
MKLSVSRVIRSADDCYRRNGKYRLLLKARMLISCRELARPCRCITVSLALSGQLDNAIMVRSSVCTNKNQIGLRLRPSFEVRAGPAIMMNRG